MSFATGFVAARAKEPTLKLDDSEAVEVAQAVANVGQHYNVPVSPVTQAWIGLGMTVGSIYAGKFAAIKFKRQAAKETVRPAAPAQPKAANGVSDDLGFAQPDLSGLGGKVQ